MLLYSDELRLYAASRNTIFNTRSGYSAAKWDNSILAIIRTISFIALGVFISLLVTRLREQQAALQQANTNLTHYASTLEQLTVSRKRNRLARELHDTLSLTALSVTLETAKAYFDIDTNKTRELLDKSLEATHSGIDETRPEIPALLLS